MSPFRISLIFVSLHFLLHSVSPAYFFVVMKLKKRLVSPPQILNFYSTQQQASPRRLIFSRDSVKEFHGRLIRTLTHTDPFAVSSLLRAYTQSSSTLRIAQLIFDQVERPTLQLWNYLIRGFSLSDNYMVGAIYLYNSLRDQGLNGDNVTFVFVFKACGRVPDLFYGKRVHVHALKLGFRPNLYVSNALIHMYGACGELGSARKVFDEMAQRDLVSWNSLICGYSNHNRFAEVKCLYSAMQRENVDADEVTFMKVLLACSQTHDWDSADSVVKEIEKSGTSVNVYLQNTLIDMYGKRGLVGLAQVVFDQMAERNLVSWNALIMGYVKAGNLVSARKLFNEMPNRDVVSWTSMITGYCQVSQFTHATKLFQEMLDAKVKPDEVTVASALSACAHRGLLDAGEEVHELIHRHNVRMDIHVGNALIDMYCKCGSIKKAFKVFQEMEEKDSVSWTSILSGLAVNGFANLSINLFEHMIQENIRPTHGSFVGILLACAHAGLVDKGLEYFERMEKVHCIVPQMKHYGCVVDLLSRSGHLERAYEFIKGMPISPDIVLWRTLLGACNVHGNVALAEIVSKKLIELDPSDSGNYVLLSNAYAGVDRWDAATVLRELIEDTNVIKPSARSSVETMVK